MKILEVISSLDDGGAETLVKDYSIMLNRDGFETKVVVLQNYNKTANYKIVKNNNVEIIPIFKRYCLITRILNRVLPISIKSRKLLRIIKKEKPECIHIHLGVLRLFYPIRKKISGIKLFYTCHNEPKYMLGNKNDVRVRECKILIKENGLKIIGLHNDMANELNELLSINDCKIIHNGIDFNRFEKVKESKDEIRKKNGISKDAFVIGHIGRFTEQKNHKFILQIFREILKEKSKSILVLIGQGTLKKEIISMSKKMNIYNNIIFLEKRSDIPQLLKMMDVFLFPSLFEGLSVTMVEAQVVGIKCVVSSEVNNESILKDTTLKVDLNKPANYWAKIILENNIRNCNFGDIKKFDLNKEIKRLEYLYSN